MMEVLTSVLRQEEKSKSMRVTMEKTNLSLFTHDVMVNWSNLKESTGGTGWLSQLSLQLSVSAQVVTSGS